MNFAIIGASGNVGRKTIEILEKSKIELDNLFLVASSKSAGKKMNFKGKELEVSDLESFDFSKVKICLLYTSPSPRDKTVSRMPSSA